MLYVNHRKSKPLSFGAFIHAVVTTTIVITPPNTTAGTKPISRAVAPDSNAPNSLDEPINRLLTAETRPRISSGVKSDTIVPRMTILTLSKKPVPANMIRENTKLCEMANKIVQIPKPPTEIRSFRPA